MGEKSRDRYQRWSLLKEWARKGKSCSSITVERISYVGVDEIAVKGVLTIAARSVICQKLGYCRLAEGFARGLAISLLCRAVLIDLGVIVRPVAARCNPVLSHLQAYRARCKSKCDYDRQAISSVP